MPNLPATGTILFDAILTLFHHTLYHRYYLFIRQFFRRLTLLNGFVFDGTLKQAQGITALFLLGLHSLFQLAQYLIVELHTGEKKYFFHFTRKPRKNPPCGGSSSNGSFSS
ncbi:MAG: hypothetical protein WDN67_00170 [Candidatus Moraniibacteriota bacterium]